MVLFLSSRTADVNMASRTNSNVTVIAGNPSQPDLPSRDSVTTYCYTELLNLLHFLLYYPGSMYWRHLSGALVKVVVNFTISLTVLHKTTLSPP